MLHKASRRLTALRRYQGANCDGRLALRPTLRQRLCKLHRARHVHAASWRCISSMTSSRCKARAVSHTAAVGCRQRMFCASCAVFSSGGSGAI